MWFKVLVPFLLVVTGCFYSVQVWALDCPGIVSIQKPFLYLLEKDGKQTYVLGTKHVGISLEQFPEYVRDAIDSSETVVFEMKSSKFLNFFALIKVAVGMFHFSGPGLSKRLTQQAWQTLNLQLVKRGYEFSETIIDRMTPSAAIIFLSADRDA